MAALGSALAAGGAGSLSFGQKAKDLIAELQAAGSALTSYNDDGVRQVVAETSALHKPFTEYCKTIYDSSPAQDLAGPIYVFSSSMKRNKRCLLAYHNRRCEVIEKLRWEHGASIPQAMRSKLCASEQDYFQIYNEILTSYMEGVGIMLTSDLFPPKDHSVEVTATADIGNLMTLSGPRDIRVGETHLMRRVDAEPLIKQGLLVYVNLDTA